jgi:hypothetical protein
LLHLDHDRFAATAGRLDAHNMAIGHPGWRAAGGG